VKLVRRTLDGNIPEALMDHFVIKDHGRETQNRGCLHDKLANYKT
jgi:hypothetical protein